MKTLPNGMQAHLDSGTTTLCHCWRLRLASGETMGFTDHDRTIRFDGTSFEAQAGFTGSEVESSLGLSVDNMEATGALQSGRLDAARLRRGDFDQAEVELWRVNWNDTAQRVLMRKGHLGEVTYGDGSFRAEVRGLAHLLGQTRGRIFQNGCDATLGDTRCGVNLDKPHLATVATVISVNADELTVSGVTAGSGWFSRGSATMISGDGAGQRLRVKQHRGFGAAALLSLWQTPGFTIRAGDRLQLHAGCDKQFETCRNKFGNGRNFRGFPHMPGTDFVTRFARQGDSTNNGGKKG